MLVEETVLGVGTDYEKDRLYINRQNNDTVEFHSKSRTHCLVRLPPLFQLLEGYNYTERVLSCIADMYLLLILIP